jgi:ADYC domain
MSISMTRLQLAMSGIATCIAIGLSGCAVESAESGNVELGRASQASTRVQGMEMQGMEMQGMEMQGMEMQGMRLEGATMSSDTLSSVRVQRGEVIAKRGSTTVRGTQLVGAHFQAQVRDISVSPPRAATAEIRITAIQQEDSAYDPTDTGHTFLYTLEQWVPDTQSWQPACGEDADGRRVAIPVAAIFDEHGDRFESSSLFTFGCTTGVIAKCYRWGYRPWISGYGDMEAMHWTCTRLARADYCGNGVPGTRNGTTINVWDRLPSPGPIQRHGGLLGLPPPGMLFEAGWNTNGAVCLSTARWLLEDGIGIAKLCPNRLVPPGLLLPTVCDTVTTVLFFDPGARMFNESYLHL